ncbi:salicylate hydroxylase [Strigomonas culicis]|uniref:Salicylate hydroxylase n=1 Tax=Strigomonas culicis TaxID=28005 RepID=S9UZT2_9TRYP|nr:salicylate hydroxylase [Strigomonas culicis]|eukprot:EPY36377.1 salicylate hydroxylase [Strigomonas culicis]
MKVRNRHVQMHALGSEDVIPLSTAPTANSNSIVSRRLAEERKISLGKVPFRTTLSATYLRDALRRHIPEIKFGATVVDLVPHDGIKGGVMVMLEDGSSEYGDVVVGADGMHSTIRKLLYPSEVVGLSSRSLGMTQIDGFVDTPHNVEGLECPVHHWGHRCALWTVPLFRHNENRISFSATLYDQPEEVLDTAMDAKDVLVAFRQLMHRQYLPFGEDIARLLSQATLAIPSEVLEVPVMPRWYNKRAVLIGEAAHGSLPSFLEQDASLCVEDAALLATALTDIPLLRDSGFEYAFKQFETVRRERVERYIRQSRRARSVAATRYTGLRDTVFKCTPSSTVYLSQKWLSSWSYSSQQLEVDPKTKVETAFR